MGSEAAIVNDPIIVNVETPPAEPPTAPEPPAEPPTEPVIVIDPQPSDLEVRIRQLENGHNLHEVTIAELRQQVETRAEAGHEHPVPPNLQALSEHLDAMETDDVPPKKKVGLMRRKLWGS